MMDQADCWEFKQVILVRTDLKMGKGKIAVQAAHASVTAIEETRKKHPEWYDSWFREGQCKVCLKVMSEKELLLYMIQAEKRNLPLALIRDKGLTQIPGGTITSLGIGPCPSKIVDPLTGDLPLL